MTCLRVWASSSYHLRHTRETDCRSRELCMYGMTHSNTTSDMPDDVQRWVWLEWFIKDDGCLKTSEVRCLRRLRIRRVSEGWKG
ncbi:hypothetical protein HanPSC8_Chr09g0368081 [Helianthus annuus]|nr:hypothetical protein HanPSC8_Chr09g0368081 [Helianthus annuus]